MMVVVARSRGKWPATPRMPSVPKSLRLSVLMSRINPKRKPLIVIETAAKPASEQSDRQGRRISDSKQFEQIGLIPGGFEPFPLDPAFGGFVLFEQVEGNTVEDGEVLRRMACAFAAEVFAEAD